MSPDRHTRLAGPIPATNASAITPHSPTLGVDRYGIHQLRMMEVRYADGMLDIGMFRELGSDEPVHGITWAPDGDLLVGELDELWKADKRTGPEERVSQPGRAHYIALDPSGTRFWLTRRRSGRAARPRHAADHPPPRVRRPPVRRRRHRRPGRAVPDDQRRRAVGARLPRHPRRR